MDGDEGRIKVAFRKFAAILVNCTSFFLGYYFWGKIIQDHTWIHRKCVLTEYKNVFR